MLSNSKNIVILAAAGSRKTEYLVEAALAATDDGRVLITTYTNENQRHIERRIEQKAGVIPKYINIMGWFSFLITQCVKPYQRALTGKPFMLGGLNFIGQRCRYTPKSDLSYFIDRNNDLYRNGVSDFAVQIDKKTNGAVIDRLQRIYSHIFIDEVQDLVGYDLEILELLISSRINLTVVGDPRQHTFSTNLNKKNKKYCGEGLITWFYERKDRCTLETRNYSYRCNQKICDFADRIFPGMPKTESLNRSVTGHDGVYTVPEKHIKEYVDRFKPVTALRYDKNANTHGLPATNIGVAKGSTHDRVIIFPTKPMLRFLEDGDAAKLKSPEKLYVAVTRACFSVAFVVPDSWGKKPLYATPYKSEK